MITQKTLSIIKPDATKRNLTGKINSKFENAGLEIIAQKRIQLTKQNAEKFYIIHKDKPFYNDLVSYMISGPVVVQVLKGENAIDLNRKIMGATNPKEADEGTIEQGLLNEFIKQTAWLFYFHEEPKHPDRYRPELER